MTDNRAPMSIQQQADFIDDLVSRCSMKGGALAGESLLTISKEVAEDLIALANRLHRMAPFEGDIKRMVTGK